MRYIELMEDTDTMPVGYPKKLDEAGLLAYACEYAVEDADDIDPEMMRELLGGYGAELKRIPISGLLFNGGYSEKAKIKRYAKMKSNPPPIIVCGKEIMDGNHRVRAALQNGETHIWAYVMFHAGEPF